MSRSTSTDEAQRRASTRRHDNSICHVRAFVRRREVAARLGEFGYGHGDRVVIARRLGVSPATISRDVAAILAEPRRCPRCGFDQPAEIRLDARQTTDRLGSNNTMINVINGKKTASNPQSSALWPLLAAIDIVKYRKMTQKAAMSSHQKNPMNPSFHAGELRAAFQVEGACESPESGEGPPVQWRLGARERGR